MADTKLKLDSLRQEIRLPLKSFAEKLKDGVGDNLQSITIVGSSLTDDFVPGSSDVNTVVVLRKHTTGAIKVLAAMVRQLRKSRLAAPLLMTENYIERSRDVFGIELLDLQLLHETIYGKDPFSNLTIAKRDVRLQCERELKATLIRLRQGFIASGANRKIVRDILASAATGLVPLLRAMLWLKDIERPQNANAVFAQAAYEFSVSVDALAEARKWRRRWKSLREDELTAAFESIYAAVEQLAEIVDGLKV
jgi:hypothetical protein